MPHTTNLNLTTLNELLKASRKRESSGHLLMGMKCDPIHKAYPPRMGKRESREHLLVGMKCDPINKVYPPRGDSMWGKRESSGHLLMGIIRPTLHVGISCGENENRADIC